VNEHAEHQTLNWISFSNAERLHEQLDDSPPTEYEELSYKTDNKQKASQPRKKSLRKPRALQRSYAGGRATSVTRAIH